MSPATDAIVIGSGPNGLAAAITLAESGKSVTVFEAEESIGGGVRSAALTLPGFVHDVCSAVHPFAMISPFFRRLPLARYGLEWVEPSAMLAHPLDDGPPAIVERSLDATANGLGSDAAAYRSSIGALVTSWSRLETTILGPMQWPRHPLALARFGWRALRRADRFARATFASERARALFGGLAAHGMLPFDRAATAAFGLVLGATTHLEGWCFPRGGAQRLTDALVAHLRSLGGQVMTGARVSSIDDLPPARAILCDLSPRPFLRIAGHRLTAAYRRRLERFRYGMGVFKVDWALNGPIPWRAREVGRAGTVHLGGTLNEMARSEALAWTGPPSEQPFVLLSQPTIFDPSRAPAGGHTAWAYCHVPNGCDLDMLPRIERQIERFAPGFREIVAARAVRTPADLERHNANFVGGDIGAGASDLGQLFTRPTWRLYSTSARGLYLCSASTPPGVGVHGMCGYFAARRAIADLFGGR
jgi:phytoene dehydrogenase-like protein